MTVQTSLHDARGFLIFHTETSFMQTASSRFQIEPLCQAAQMLSGAAMTIDGFCSTAYHKLGDTRVWLWAFWDFIYDLHGMEGTSSLSLTYREKVGDTM